MGNWTGILRLDAEERRGKTVARNVYFQGALKVMRPIYHDESGQACYYILNPGGGYLDGDRYRMQFLLEENAKLTLTTQSATKVYRTPKLDAYQETEVIMKKGSYLEYIPDPLIAYRNAKYRQKNVFRLEKGATLFYTDIITPGWSPDGKLFSYSMLQLMNEIYIDDQLAVFDHIKLSPSSQIIAGLGFMEGYTHLGSMIVVGEQTSRELLDRLYQDVHSTEKTYSIGLSMLPVPGFAMRILANSTQVIEGIFSDCHHILSKDWFNKRPSFLRKY
ncbi:urease accessory protein UreD [Neobacillus piezotolerans]|uniref:Urease accessory protein UreD n=1 Tax=Neobacillus piezotolerans TaxID=2259171 RepID=A0A3D8GRM8_9BACI|nr:urease accessory protein UreD [Neobacillus piezotolerans]RDU36736.1 urease accessory protein UreD [Neobacillus piezotolerans]